MAKQAEQTVEQNGNIEFATITIPRKSRKQEPRIPREHVEQVMSILYEAQEREAVAVGNGFEDERKARAHARQWLRRIEDEYAEALANDQLRIRSHAFDANQNPEDPNFVAAISLRKIPVEAK
jgi:hypothetical protein